MENEEANKKGNSEELLKAIYIFARKIPTLIPH